MSRTTNPNASTTDQKSALQVRIMAPEGINGMAPYVQVDLLQVVTTTGLAPIITTSTAYSAPLATCFAGTSTATLAATLNVTPAALKTALVAWFDGLISEALNQ